MVSKFNTMNIKEQIINEIRTQIQEGTNCVQIGNDDFNLELTFELAKVTTYEEPETNYTEWDIIGEFFADISYIEIKGAELCKADMISIVKEATSDYTIIC